MNRLEERNWNEPELLAWRSRFITSQSLERIPFAGLEWIDLWPLSQLTKLLYNRLRKDGFPTHIDLPIWKFKSSAQQNNKPLCFLIDIGFVALAARWGASFAIAGKTIRFELDEQSQTGLSHRSLTSMEEFGYWNKEYKDKIVLPLTLVSKHADIDRLRARMRQYVDNYISYYTSEIADSHFIDTFFRELTENAIEHSIEKIAFVAARFIRSVWDIPPSDKRASTIQKRTRGKLPPMQLFLNEHPYDGYVELMVVDDGIGIHGTLSPHLPSDQRNSPELFQAALKPEQSCHPPDVRIQNGKSPLTGLGECANRLPYIPALLVFREENLGCAVNAATHRSSGGPPALKFSTIEDLAELRVTGCNIQFAMAVRAKAHIGRRLNDGRTTQVAVGYSKLLEDFRTHNETIRTPSAVEITTIASDSSDVCKLIDISGAPEDKDSVWNCTQRILAVPLGRTPLILVGVTDTLCEAIRAALETHFRRPKIHTHQKITPILAVTSRLEFCVIGASELSANDILRSLESGSTRHLGVEQRQSIDTILPIAEDGSVTISPSGIAQAWFNSIGKWIIHIASNMRSGYIWNNTCIELPNGVKVSGYCDLFEILHDDVLRPALSNALQLAVAEYEPELLINYSAPTKTLCRDLVSRDFSSIRHLDFSDMSRGSDRFNDLSLYKGRRAIILGDAIHSGRTASRIVTKCIQHDVDVRAHIALLDSRSDDEPPRNIGCIDRAIMSMPFPLASSDEMPKAFIDKVTLRVSTNADHETERGTVFRDTQHGAAMYNYLYQQGALDFGHASHEGGHHFASWVDFRALTQLQHIPQIYDALAPIADGCAGIVYPEGAEIGRIVPDLAKKCGIPSVNIVPALLGHRISRDYAFTSRHASLLREIGNTGGTILFLDDAIHNGRALRNIAAKLTLFGIKSIRAWFILNNTAPGSAIVSSLLESNGMQVQISQHWMWRSFFPAFNSSSSCPVCRIIKAHAQSMSSYTPSMFKHYLKYRVTQLDPCAIEERIRDPWRYDEPVSWVPPQCVIDVGIPKLLPHSASIALAISELSQFEEGVKALCQEKPASHSLQNYAHIVRILSCRMSTLDKLNCLDLFLHSYFEQIALVSGEAAAGMLECALLWPREILHEQVNELVKLLALPHILSNDSCLAVFYSVVKLVLQHASEKQRPSIVANLTGAKELVPKDSSRRRIASALVGSLILTSDVWETYRWSLTVLARRLGFRREKHHRLLEQVLNLGSTLQPSSVQHVLGIISEDSARNYLAMMISLGEIHRALTNLIEVGELSKGGTTTRLCRHIEAMLAARARLRIVYGQYSPTRDSDIATLCDVVTENLQKIGLLLQPDDVSQRADELFALLQSRWLDPIDAFVDRLSSELVKLERVSIKRDTRKDQMYKRLLVLCDNQVIQAVLAGISSNIRKHVLKYDLICEVHIIYELRPGGRFYLSVQNSIPSDGENTASAFGPDMLIVQSEIRRYGGDYQGQRVGKTFETVVELQTLQRSIDETISASMR